MTDQLTEIIASYLPPKGTVEYRKLRADMNSRGFSDDEIADALSELEVDGTITPGTGALIERATPKAKAQRQGGWPGGFVVGVRLLDPAAALPAFAHDGDAGADLVAAASVHIPSGSWALVPTGLAIAIPHGYVGLIHPRSGVAARFGVTVLNAPGTVDSGYRGQVEVNLINHSRYGFSVEKGDRIAQLLIQRVERPCFAEVAELGDTERGTGGHGSTGGVSAR